MKVSKIPLVFMFSLSLAIAWVSWDIVVELEEAKVQSIASAISTVSGILLGFVLASVTILLSAKDNALIQNTQKTQYMPKLIRKLHFSMGLFLVVCVIFLVSLFIPDTKMLFKDGMFHDVKLLSLNIELGVFIFSFAVIQFISVWLEFSKFVSLM